MISHVYGSKSMDFSHSIVPKIPRIKMVSKTSRHFVWMDGSKLAKQIFSNFVKNEINFYINNQK